MASEIHIPFRCPKCGDRRKFDSLHDLRRHLEHEHSYASSRSQQQHHISGIDARPRGGRRSPLTEMFRADAEHLEESLRLSKEEEANNKKFRRDYSGLGSSKVTNGYGYKDFPHRIRNDSAQSSFRDFGHSSRYQKYYTAPKYANDKQNNMQHIHVLDRSDIDDSFSKSFSQGKSQNTLPFPPLRSQTHFDTTLQPTSFANVGERHIKDTLSALSQEVLMERANQHETANSLYTAQDMLTSVEQAAEIKIAQQQKVIETLAERLKEKEKKLGIVMHEIKHLGQQQIESMEKVSILRQESEFKTEDLQQQLIKKQHELDALNQKMSEIQHALVKGQISAFQKPDHLSNDGSFGKVNHITENMSSPLNEDSTKHYARRSEPSGKEGYPHNSPYKLPSKPVLGDSNSKEREMTKIKSKAQQLDRDRQNLLIEMQSLLEAAATDNLKLHEELEGRSQELTQLNSDLEQSKQEQAELLEETNALYHQADLSLGKLKMMLKEKEQQLINVTSSLEQARATQVRLAKERDESLKLASEREAVYNSLISSNSFQVQSMKEILNSSIEEKKKLEQKLKDLTQELTAKDGQDKLLSENVGFLKARLAEKEKSQVKMKEELRKREEKLKKAKHEMERMTKFLKDTAEKELEARSKLEDFISGLIDRAGQAEAELQKLKESFGTMSERASRHSGKKVKQTTKVPDLSLLPGVSFTESRKHPDDSDQTETPNDSRLHKDNYHSKPHRHKSTSEPKTKKKYAERNNELKRVSLSPMESGAQRQRPQDADKKRYFQSHPDRDQDISDELSLDEHGIMWEPPISRSYSSKPISTMSKTGQHNVHDDTDIDEDLTDYIHEDEQVSHDESVEPEYFISKPKRFSSKHVTKAKIADLENDPVPLGDKIAKLLTSLDRKPYHSSARDDYSRNLYANNSQKQKVSSKAANEYSAGDSSDSSPLHKARDVQKRVEQLMQPKPPRVARTISFSKQSDGFDVCQVESDLSSSSYASLGPIKSNTKQMENKTNDDGDRVKKSIKQQEKVFTSTPVKENVYTSAPVKENMYTSTPAKELKDHLSILSVNDHPNSTVEETKKDPDIKRVENKPGVSHGYPLASQLHSQDEYAMNNQSRMENLDTGQSNPYLEAQVSGSRLGEDNHVLDDKESTRQEETEQDRDLVKYQEAELKPAKELRVRVSLQDEIQETLSEDDSLKEHSETRHFPNTHENLHVSALVQAESTQAVSSEDDLLDEEPLERSPSARKESVDASTDTDLEKLAKPGYLQKGFTVRKNIPVVKHIRRKQRPKPVLKRAPSDDSISSSAEDLDDNERLKRRSIRRMRIALFRIFSYLDTPSLIQVSCVSKDWCRVSRHPSLWKHVTLENRAISSEFMVTLSQWCTQTQSLTLQGLTGRGIRADESSEDYQATLRGSLEPGLERFLSCCQNTITCLYISDCDNLLTDKCLWLVSGYCRLLTKLTYQNKSDPITPQLMWALGGGCPGVTSLFVQPKYPCAKINSMNNRCLLLIGQFYKDLQEVGLGGKEFDIAGLLPFVQSCQRLKFILFDHCMTITNDSATALCRTGLKNLHTLHIIGTNIEAKALQTFQGNCRQLKTIVVKMKLQDCVEDPSKKKDKENYKKMVKALEALKTKAGIGNIFTLEAGPPD